MNTLPAAQYVASNSVMGMRSDQQKLIEDVNVTLINANNLMYNAHDILNVTLINANNLMYNAHDVLNNVNSAVVQYSNLATSASVILGMTTDIVTMIRSCLPYLITSYFLCFAMLVGFFCKHNHKLYRVPYKMVKRKLKPNEVVL